MYYLRLVEKFIWNMKNIPVVDGFLELSHATGYSPKQLTKAADLDELYHFDVIKECSINGVCITDQYGEIFWYYRQKMELNTWEPFRVYLKGFDLSKIIKFDGDDSSLKAIVEEVF